MTKECWRRQQRQQQQQQQQQEEEEEKSIANIFTFHLENIAAAIKLSISEPNINLSKTLSIGSEQQRLNYLMLW